MLGAQRPEEGAGAYPQTAGRRPGWEQIEQDVSKEAGGPGWPAAGKAKRLAWRFQAARVWPCVAVF